MFDNFIKLKQNIDELEKEYTKLVKRENYEISDKFSVTYDYYNIGKDIVDLLLGVNSSGIIAQRIQPNSYVTINHNELIKIVNKHKHIEGSSCKDIFTCPNCGKNTLIVLAKGVPSDIKGNYKVNYLVTCKSCNFECPESSVTYDGAFPAFVKWLIKEKYIDCM